LGIVVRIFLKTVEIQSIRNLEVAESIQSLNEEMKTGFSEILSSKGSVKTLDYIFTNPVFKNSKFTSNSGSCSYSSYIYKKTFRKRSISNKIRSIW